MGVPSRSPASAPGGTRVPTVGTRCRSQARGTWHDPVFASKSSVLGPGTGMAPARGLRHRPRTTARPATVTLTGAGDRDRDGFGVAAVQRRTRARPLLLCQRGTWHSASPLPGLSSGWGTPTPAPEGRRGTRTSVGRRCRALLSLRTPRSLPRVMGQVAVRGVPGTRGSVSLPATSSRCPHHRDPLALAPQLEASVDRRSW